MDLADGWTRVGGQSRKSQKKKIGNSRIIDHNLPAERINIGVEVSPFSDQLDTAEISVAAALDVQTESSSADLSNGRYVSHLRTHGDYTTMPGWYSEKCISGTGNAGRNRKNGKQRVPRTAEEEVGRIITRLEQGRLMVQQSNFYSKFSGQWRKLDLLSRLMAVQNSLSSEDASSSTADVVVSEKCEVEATPLENVKSEEFPGAPSLDIVVYGIGSFSDSESSRCQLSLSFLLAHMIEAEGSGYHARVHVFDPVLTTIEHAALESIGGHPITVNEEGRRVVSGPTIFYMPHCEAHLYNNVLEANKEPPGRLKQIAILGNSFEGYRDRWSSGSNKGPTRPHTLLELQKKAVEVHVDAAQFQVQSAFNDMSWHFFAEDTQDI